MTQIDDIRARLNAITPGEWNFYDGYIRAMPGFVRVMYVENSDPDAEAFIAMSPEDEYFVASAPADLRALLNQHDADQQRIAALENELQSIAHDAELDGNSERVHSCQISEDELLSSLQGIAQRARAALKGVDDDSRLR